MHTLQSDSGPSWRSVALTGALTGIGLAFAYTLFFALYAVLRSSLTVGSLTPAEVGVVPTLVANGASILMAALATATLLAMVMAVIGMVTALLIGWLLALFNRNHLPVRALVIGAAAACVLSFACQLGVDILLELALGRSLFSLGAATYLFWFGLPALLHIAGGALGAGRLNLHQTAGPPISDAGPGMTLASQAT
jgi:hypothetical protein